MAAVGTVTTQDLNLTDRPVIEELTIAPAPLVIGGVRRATLVVVALIACIGLALAGSDARTDTAAVDTVVVDTPNAAIAVSDAVVVRPPVLIETPSAGTVETGPTVDVVVVATAELATARIAMVVGDAVVGWQVARDVRAGPFIAHLEVLAPPTRLPAQLVVSGIDADGPFEVRQDVVLQVAAPILIWRASPGADDGTLVVDGAAPLTAGELEIRAITADHRVVAQTVSSVAIDPWRHGAEGGRLLGVGSFRAIVRVDHPDAERVASVVVAAADLSIGEVTVAVIR